MKKTPSKRSAKAAGKAQTTPVPERRKRRALREVLDELVEYVRELSRTVPNMRPSEMEYAQERLEWLADEVWRLVLEGGGDLNGGIARGSGGRDSRSGIPGT
ncbi:MAG: hypothetical protein GTN62_03910 [Gemmatimonadales bacterium]|nr:hypothetical protein [Gemmatimonadales bacterium]NIN49245.1 hypothetical protein [Gemmatimonadales bacterium]NIP06709.1 hypothetical protein [Gemmatimonadales bacterium]NIR00040.1 hypothetical protein [Gemmatimonadales bacterium]NIS64498.1 hypothetical protein [Gemmatimonadales bacterium]